MINKKRSVYAVSTFNGFCDIIRVWKFPVFKNMRTLKKYCRRLLVEGKVLKRDMSWYWIQKYTWDNKTHTFVPVENKGCKIC